MMSDTPAYDAPFAQPPAGATLAFQTELDAGYSNVREAVIHLRTALEQKGCDADTAGNVELVVAEALNNITEHAYHDTVAGEVKLTAHIDRSRLYLTIIDAGSPMPDARLPEGKERPTAQIAADLPEGGFGWNIILQLCDDVQYQRCCDRNQLLLQFERTLPTNS